MSDDPREICYPQESIDGYSLNCESLQFELFIVTFMTESVGT